MRDFEVPACGSFTLTENAFDLSTCFVPNKEVVFYQSNKDLLEKIKYYLGSPSLIEDISNAGQKRAYSEHKYTDRLKYILSHF